jgi:Zn-dependent metalloprotease
MARGTAWRREEGQTATELMGALLLVSLIIAALFATDVDARIRDQVHRAICSIGAGTDCGTPDRSGGYADEPYEDSGLADQQIYDDDCQGDIPDDPARAGDDGSVGDDQVDRAYENLGRVYDYYRETFGWDSYDGRGAPVVGVVNYCDGGSDSGVSQWSDGRVLFAPGAGDALDTAAHEFTHGVTENTAGLEYQCQSGALNESISDIMAWNLDPADPTYGEDRNGDGPDDPDGGTIRDYSQPTRFDQPMHVDDYEASPNDAFGDWGGVHTNSGIPNHAYYQLVVRVGRDKAEQIVWRALTQHLEPDSGFEDFRGAMLDSAAELYGAGGPEEHGVDEAFATVGLDGNWEAPEQEGC